VALAAAAAEALDARPGGTWVRLRFLDAAHYGEGDGGPPSGVTPVFVSVVMARPPTGRRLADAVRRLTGAIAAGVGRSAEHVHVTFEPAAVGRVAFGGKLVADGEAGQETA
jgi:phenylpyruvate tautomerase PptA (4-oxalocrotonate tautomerase family)